MRKGGRFLSFTVPAAWLKAWVGAGSVGGGVVVEGAAVDGCGVVGSIVVAGGVAVSVAVSSIPASAKPPLRRWPRRVQRARLFSHPRPSYAAAYARARRIEHGKQPHGDTLGSFARRRRTLSAKILVKTSSSSFMPPGNIASDRSWCFNIARLLIKGESASSISQRRPSS